MYHDKIEMIVPDREKHREEVARMWPGVQVQVAAQLADPYCDWATSRAGVINGRPVTFWGVFDLCLRIGAARVRTAGVNWVVTRSGYRRRGLMTHTGWAALEAMAQNGYDLTLLNGVENVYGRFGYVFAWPKTNFLVRTEDLPPERFEGEVHEFLPTHREDLAQLYNRENAQLTGTAVRPTFRGFKWPGSYHRGFFWAGENGRPTGYLIGSGGPGQSGYPFDFVDAAGDPEEILRVLGMLARRWGYPDIQFDRLHPRSALARRLRRANCKIETEYHKDGGYSIRVVNLRSLLEKMGPELAGRLCRSHLSGWQGVLGVSNGEEEVAVSIDKGEVRVGPPQRTPHTMYGGQEVAQLVIGTAPPGEVLAASKFSLTGDAGALARVLFPAQSPQLSVVDL